MLFKREKKNNGGLLISKIWVLYHGTKYHKNKEKDSKKNFFTKLNLHFLKTRTTPSCYQKIK
jgi:hypothetical protein